MGGGGGGKRARLRVARLLFPPSGSILTCSSARACGAVLDVAVVNFARIVMIFVVSSFLPEGLRARLVQVFYRSCTTLYKSCTRRDSLVALRETAHLIRSVVEDL